MLGLSLGLSLGAQRAGGGAPEAMLLDDEGNALVDEEGRAVTVRVGLVQETS